jgi:glucosylglycerate hydrolase
MLESTARPVLDAAWRDPGFCVPHAGTYPFQWLWDSCFHSVVWAELGDERAVTELSTALAHQSPSGFVPHLTYWAAPDHHAGFWGRDRTSSLTQPPMYGHAVAACLRRGLEVPGEVVARAEAGLRFLLERRERTATGLVAAVHPWETGCDDSPRWDDWCPGFDPADWYAVKGELVAALRFDGGDPTSSSAFTVGAVGFNALIAWNVRELASVGAAAELQPAADELVDALAARWDPARRTWTDADAGSGTCRTVDALLPVLVDPRPEPFADLVDPGAYGAPHGPRGVHPDEPAYQPDRYWRGPAWPQLTYLLALAARRAGEVGAAAELARCLVRGAARSEVAEYWHPDSGRGLGARPQSWTTLAVLAARWLGEDRPEQGTATGPEEPDR